MGGYIFSAPNLSHQRLTLAVIFISVGGGFDAGIMIDRLPKS